MVMNAIIRFVYLAARCSLRSWVCMCLCEAERIAHDAHHTSLLLQHYYFAVKAHDDATGRGKIGMGCRKNHKETGFYVAASATPLASMLRPPGACSSRCYDRNELFQTDHSFFSHAMGVSFLQPFFQAVFAVVRVSFVRGKKPPTADEDDHEGNGLSFFVVLSMLERAPLGCFL